MPAPAPKESISDKENQHEKPEQQRRQKGVSAAASDLLAARMAPKRELIAIFGSVSASDVATAMKAVLATNDEAARVVFGEEDVRFVNVKDENGKTGETDRVKYLGDYQVEVRVKGAEAIVKRVVRVLAQQT